MNANIDISNVILETDRLILRAFKENDLDDLFEYAKVEGVGEHAGWAHHKNKEESKRILNMFIDERKVFAIVYKENNKVIGSLGIENVGEKELIDDVRLGRELGFVLSKDYWGQGIVPEACKRVIDYLFNDVGLDFITCAYFKWNIQSKRVQEKIGFNYYKEKTYNTQYDTHEDAVVNILYK